MTSVPGTSSCSDRRESKVFKCCVKGATKQPFTILLIGNTKWSSQLSEAMIEYQENNSIGKIQVNIANSVELAISSLSNIYADLVIILLDIRKNDCLVDAEKNLLALESSLLCGRTIFVNPINKTKRSDMAITYENIENLKRKYNLIILHGNVDDYLSKAYLTRRIMLFSNKINNCGLPNILEFGTLNK